MYVHFDGGLGWIRVRCLLVGSGVNFLPPNLLDSSQSLKIKLRRRV